MTREDAEEAMKAVARAILALESEPPNVKVALGEIADAHQIVSSGAVPSPYADKGLRRA